MKHIREFDGLRGLLALWVFLAHLIETGPYWAATRHVHANGAVDVFIILSGFVIFYLLSRGEDYRTFITRRWFRLFPVFAVCFLIALALHAALGIEDDIAFGITNQEVTPHLIAHATMLHGVVPEEALEGSARAILPPAWSVSVEWQFYLLAPILFLVLKRPLWKPMLVLGVLVALRLAHEWNWPSALSSGMQSLTFGMDAFLPLKLELFAVGAACCALWLHVDRQPGRIIPGWCCIAVLLGVILLGPLRPAIAVWLAFFAAVLQATFGQPDAAVGARQAAAIFTWKPVQFLGRISYPLYLLHLPMIVAVREMLSAAWPNPSPFAFQSLVAALSLPFSIAGAWALHAVLEQPMIRLGRILTQPRQSGLKQATPGRIAIADEETKSAACRDGALVH